MCACMIVCVYNIVVNHKVPKIFTFVCKTGSSSSFVVKEEKKKTNQSDLHIYNFFYFNNGYFQIPPKVLFLLSCLKGLLFPEKLLLLPPETELI